MSPEEIAMALQQAAMRRATQPPQGGGGGGGGPIPLSMLLRMMQGGANSTTPVTDWANEIGAQPSHKMPPQLPWRRGRLSVDG